MNSASEVSVTAQGRESWLPLLQLAATEVFEIMLGAKLEPVTEASSLPACEITSMVGLAGQLCGVLTLRCSFGRLLSWPQRCSVWNRKKPIRSFGTLRAKSATW
jgi:hypothetical protein